MSIVEIVDHNEVIFTILDRPPPSPPATPRYYSALEKKLKRTKKEQTRRDFGYAAVPLTPPDKFMKKGEGQTQPVKKSDHKCIKGDLPPVPKRPPPEKKVEKPVVNYRVLNIKRAIKAKTKKVNYMPRLVDTRDGHVKVLHNSGEIPQFSLRKDFGQVPEYLQKRNQKRMEMIQKYQEKERNKPSFCTLITEEERKKLLDELKAKWALMQKNFLQLPMLTDTIPKVLKKSKMENELRQIEKDIQLVENNPYIYIY